MEHQQTRRLWACSAATDCRIRSSRRRTRCMWCSSLMALCRGAGSWLTILLVSCVSDACDPANPFWILSNNIKTGCFSYNIDFQEIPLKYISKFSKRFIVFPNIHSSNFSIFQTYIVLISKIVSHFSLSLWRLPSSHRSRPAPVFPCPLRWQRVRIPGQLWLEHRSSQEPFREAHLPDLRTRTWSQLSLWLCSSVRRAWRQWRKLWHFLRN